MSIITMTSTSSFSVETSPSRTVSCATLTSSFLGLPLGLGLLVSSLYSVGFKNTEDPAIASQGSPLQLSVKILSKLSGSGKRLTVLVLSTPLGVSRTCSSVLSVRPTQTPLTHKLSSLQALMSVGTLAITISPNLTSGDE